MTLQDIKLSTYWTLLEEEFKPRANRIISVIDLWTNSKQGQLGLSEWITKVYNPSRIMSLQCCFQGKNY